MTPKSFCESLPMQPRVWDPTRLAILDTCPRKHLLATIRGLRRNGLPSVHLTWGKDYHECVEEYDRAVLDNEHAPQASAISLAIAKAGKDDWGETIQTWRCTDPEMVPAKRMKVWKHRETGEIVDAPPARSLPEYGVDGEIIEFSVQIDPSWELVPKMIQNRARCKFAKGGQPLGEQLPFRICECGQPVEKGETFVPYDPKKTGETLIAAVKAYCESTTSLKPYEFPGKGVRCHIACTDFFENGGSPDEWHCRDCEWDEPPIPALELQARLPLPIMSPDDEPVPGVEGELGWRRYQPYELLVNIDSLVEWEGDIAIRERKTTGRPLDWHYWAQFHPNAQIETYDLVGSVLYQDEDSRPPKIMVEAMRVGGAEGPEIERRVIRITEAQRAETFREIQSLILDAEKRAVDVSAGIDPEVAFPRRPTACVQGFRVCPFYDVCTASPGDREAIIAANYHEERWSPEDAESFTPEGESNEV